MTEAKAILEIIPKIMSEVGPIKKEMSNGGLKFKTRGIDQVMARVNPLFSKYGVTTTSRIVDHNAEVRVSSKGSQQMHRHCVVEYTFTAADGSYVCTQVFGEAMDSSDKAAAKCLSIAYKYAVFQMLCIPVAEDDPDQYSPTLGGNSDSNTSSGNVSDSAPSMDSNGGDYVVNFGKFKGKRFSDIPQKDAMNYADFLNKQKDLNGPGQRFVTEVVRNYG